MEHENGVLTEGARRVWKYQRALWWWFFLNFLLAQFAASAMSAGISKIADHSFYSQRLYNGFDVAAFAELASNPEAGFSSRSGAATYFSFIFFFVAVFLTGGILEAYRTARKLSIRDFFAACGQFFWRWIRLLVFMLIVLVPVALLASGVNKWSSNLSSDSPVEKLGFYILLGGMLVVLLLSMLVRLWFDMAQVRAVALDERAMRRSMVQGFKLTLRHFGSLFWMYFRISFLAWLWLCIAFMIWTKIPGQHLTATIFLFEITIFWWIATRLWQRASETVWYERYAAEQLPLRDELVEISPGPMAERFESDPVGSWAQAGGMPVEEAPAPLSDEKPVEPSAEERGKAEGTAQG